MKNATLSLLMLALALPMPIVALAQDDEEAYFEEVIVTATRREGAMMDVTQSIQAVGEEQLELPTLSDLSEVHNPSLAQSLSATKLSKRKCTIPR